MWANSVWGFFTLGFAFILARLTLSPGQAWLRPLLFWGAISCFVLSGAILLWPLRSEENRKKTKAAFRHPARLMP